MQPVGAKQSCSLNLRSTHPKLLQAFLPQHRVLQLKEGTSQSELGALNTQSPNYKEPEREMASHPHVYMHTCRPAPHSPLDEQEDLLKSSVSPLPTTAGQIGHSSTRDRAEALTDHHLATSHIAFVVCCTLTHGAVKYEALERELEGLSWLE